jgi:hypothetical protein
MDEALALYERRQSVSDEAATALICLQELWIKFDNTLYVLKQKGEWQERIEAMRTSHDAIWGKLIDFIREMYEGKQPRHTKVNCLSLLSDLQARYTFTLDLLSDRGENPETVNRMHEIFDDTIEMLSELIQELYKTNYNSI